MLFIRRLYSIKKPSTRILVEVVAGCYTPNKPSTSTSKTAITPLNAAFAIVGSPRTTAAWPTKPPNTRPCSSASTATAISLRMKVACLIKGPSIRSSVTIVTVSLTLRMLGSSTRMPNMYSSVATATANLTLRMLGSNTRMPNMYSSVATATANSTQSKAARRTRRQNILPSSVIFAYGNLTLKMLASNMKIPFTARRSHALIATTPFPPRRRAYSTKRLSTSLSAGIAVRASPGWKHSSSTSKLRRISSAAIVRQSSLPKMPRMDTSDPVAVTLPTISNAPRRCPLLVHLYGLNCRQTSES